jgi:hypothetical protein
MTPFLPLLLSDEVGDLIKSLLTAPAATQEPLYVEDANRSMSYFHQAIKEQKAGQVVHRVYPYSVVDGGVHSVQELQTAIWRDPVVAKHYSNFRLDRARVIEAKADRDFHVSYRSGEEIFWTKKRLKVAKGEKLITDGTNFTRTRCANMLSEVPQGKTSPDEPAPELLDTPTLPPSDPPPFVPPVVIGEGPPVTTLPPSDPPPFIPPVVIGGGPAGPADGSKDGDGDRDDEGDPSVPVPEPTTLLLLGSGLAGLWGLRKKFKK